MNPVHGGMVVTPEPLAAEAGAQMLARGGNAVDAAVAAAFVQGVVNPLLCGLGGSGLLMVHHQPTGSCVNIDCSCTMGSQPVPSAWVTGYKGRSEAFGRYIVDSETNQFGYQSIMVPGFVLGAWEAVHRFGSGKLSWTELLHPAIRLASEGFRVYPYLASIWADVESKPGYPSLQHKLVAHTAAADTYSDPQPVGAWFVQPNVGATITHLATHGAASFYQGDLADRIIADFQSHNALITSADLHDYEVTDMPVVVGHYRGHEIRAAVSGCSSSPQVLATLQILEGFNLNAMDPLSPDYIDLLSGTMRAGFVDHLQLKGDPPFSVAARLLAKFTSKERAQYWQERIRMEQVYGPLGASGLGAGTTHVSVVDQEGSAVSWTHTIGSVGGAGVVTPELGFLYNNFVGHFHPLPGSWDSILPGKRGGGGAPLLLYKDGHLVMAIGAPGGSRIITAIVQVIVNVIDHGMSLAEAVAAPRFHAEENLTVYLEPSLPEETTQALLAKGYQVHKSSYMARVQAIMVGSNGTLHGGADPRGGGGLAVAV